jgi:phospholipid transport system transporter-binding protein
VAGLEKTSDGGYRLFGELVFDTVSGVLRSSERLFEGADELVIDLADVSRADSAGLALLMEWVKRADLKKKSIKYNNMPEKLLNIARVSTVEDLLPLADR